MHYIHSEHDKEIAFSSITAPQVTFETKHFIPPFPALLI